MPDLSGEAILEEVDHPHTYPVIRAFLSKCAGVLILVDAVRLMEGEKDQDFFAMKMLSYLSEMDDDPKTRLAESTDQSDLHQSGPVRDLF